MAKLITSEGGEGLGVPSPQPLSCTTGQGLKGCGFSTLLYFNGTPVLYLYVLKGQLSFDLERACFAFCFVLFLQICVPL